MVETFENSLVSSVLKIILMYKDKTKLFRPRLFVEKTYTYE